MSSPRFAIGIDLGTTNCALAYADLRQPDSRPQALAIPQLDQLDRIVEQPLLPSCLYYATAAEMARGWVDPLDSGTNPAEMGIVVGLAARERMTEWPGRVVHSAKSWLSHAGVDREAQLLPFASEDIPAEMRLSPAEASAAYLEHLKRAWDAAFARSDPGNAFVKQRVVITVPATFDESAQALTRRAAEFAGYPADLRLLEEPQAAFYAWLAGTAQDADASPSERLLASLPRLAADAQTILVCDVGGGTSDFCLFRVEPVGDAPTSRELPPIERIATSDHLLLGGDNIDLALAHCLEQGFTSEGTHHLSRRQWMHLLPQARRLKECALQEGGDPQDTLHVALPGDGGSLFAGALTLGLGRQQARDLVLDGFFPMAERSDRPRQRSAGLREMGLPYAADSAISRHLAAFLDGRSVDAVLCVGGSLQPAPVRERLRELIGGWQGHTPVVLRLPDMNLAVALGAARYAALAVRGEARIRGGYPRSVHLELRSEDAVPQLVCVLPQGFEEGGRLTLNAIKGAPRFDLLVNQPVRFSAWTSHRRPLDLPGSMTPLDPAAFHPLPPLFATIVVDETALALRQTAAQQLRVDIEATLTELGVLQLALLSHDTGQRWELEFNLRPSVRRTGDAEKKKDDDANNPALSASALDAAHARISLFFGKKQSLDAKDNVKSLPKDLERILKAERSEWRLPVLRALWPALHEGIARRARSLAHENTWLTLAGYFLRPGYGSDLDPWRMAQCWECFEQGLVHPKDKSAQASWWILWRRTAGGLSAEQQTQLFEAARTPFFQSPAEQPEATRLLANLERLAPTHKEALTERLLTHIVKGRAEKQAHVFWALARLLNRHPLYAAADAVMPASAVEACFKKLENMDWRSPALQGLSTVFTAACRRTDMRGLDIDDAIRLGVIEKLRQSGARREQLLVVQEYHALTQADRNDLFGEELPDGLGVVSG